MASKRKPAETRRKVGRPTKRTPAVRDKLLDGLRAGLPIRHAAWGADVSVDTIERWRREDRSFADACEKAIAEGDRPIIAKIRDRALHDGDIGALIWICKARIPEFREPKDQPVQIEPKGEGVAGMAAALVEMAKQVATGTAPASALEAVAKAIEKVSAVVERADLEARLIALEEARR